MRAAKLLLAPALLTLLAAGAPRALASPRARESLAPVAAPVRASLARAHAARRGPTVSAALSSLLRKGQIPTSVYEHDLSVYVAAKRSLARLSGTRREELGAVLANVQAIAAAGQLTASRAPVVFLTLERNRSWWTTGPLLSGSQRVGFPASRIVWEHYPGQGLEIQWLATFGKANGYFLSGHENEDLRQLLGEVLPLATSRAGGIAWEYMFRFDGGVPPWTSGLSQGTALQVFSRAWSRLKEPAYLTAAQQALKLFTVAPPQGVRVATKAGAEYAEYTYAPSDRILNGFVQALVGLYDYTEIAKDPLGLSLFEAGDAEARAEVPRYDTGAWSMYDQFGESDLNYHELLTEFLEHLCERTTRNGSPLPPASPPSAPPSTTTSGTPSPSGGASAARTAATHAAAQPVVPIPGDEIYCTTAQRFRADLRTPPAISLLSTRLPTHARAGVKISLSKISTVHMTVKRGSRVVWTNAATVEGGKPRLLWVTPSTAGAYTIVLTATDLAGNFATANGTVTLSRH